MTKIELDSIRISKYQELKNNLEAVKEFFRHGDVLIRQVNNVLQEIKNLIDNTEETSFTQEDFNDMLTMRNEVLAPIFQNASFAVEFTLYPLTKEEVKDNVISLQEAIVENIDNKIIEGILYDTVITTTQGNKTLKTIKLSYQEGIIVETITTEYLENSTKVSVIKFLDNKQIYNVSTLITGNITEIIKTNFENGIAISTTYTEYINGLIVDTITTTI